MTDARIDYNVVHEFADKHRLSYNELCGMVRAALAAPQSQQQVVAWAHPDGRVVPASTMDSARSDGGAMLSSLTDYTIALVAIAAPQAVEEPLTEEHVQQLQALVNNTRISAVESNAVFHALQALGIKQPGSETP